METFEICVTRTIVVDEVRHVQAESEDDLKLMFALGERGDTVYIEEVEQVDYDIYRIED